MLSINIIGSTKVQTRLGSMMGKDKLESALDKAGFIVEHDAKRIVRVDKGRLKNSIDVIKKPLTRYVGSSVEYAAAQEFGRPDLKSYGYTPYLRPAIRKNSAKIQKLIKDSIGVL